MSCPRNEKDTWPRYWDELKARREKAADAKTERLSKAEIVLARLENKLDELSARVGRLEVFGDRSTGGELGDGSNSRVVCATSPGVPGVHPGDDGAALVRLADVVEIFLSTVSDGRVLQSLLDGLGTIPLQRSLDVCLSLIHEYWVRADVIARVIARLRELRTMEAKVGT
jgi:hypothetical protein